MPDPSDLSAITNREPSARPLHVSLAVGLQYLSLALGQVTTALLRPYFPHHGQTVFIQIATVAVLVWLAYLV